MKEYTKSIRNYPYRVRESGTGVPLIWLHGMFHSLDTEELFSVLDFNLLARNIRLIRVELPGHGISPLQPDAGSLTWPSLAADIRELALEVNAPDYFAGGFSQGAGISAHMAAENPGLNGLVLMMLPNIWESRQQVRNTYSKLIIQLEKERNNDVLERLFRIVRYLPLNMGWHEETAGKINSLMLQMDTESVISILKGAILSDMPDPEIFSKTGIPVMTGAWAGDPNHPVSIYEQVNSVKPPDDTFLVEGKFNRITVTSRVLSFLTGKSTP